mmetsp:Transcript_83420/g.223376  ORF Transcript_83420/g.223376 Transcript_83420/m.223376 type:complete len:224 (-) Transcript_83420:380-1051(-)
MQGKPVQHGGSLRRRSSVRWVTIAPREPLIPRSGHVLPDMPILLPPLWCKKRTVPFALRHLLALKAPGIPASPCKLVHLATAVRSTLRIPLSIRVLQAPSRRRDRLQMSQIVLPALKVAIALAANQSHRVLARLVTIALIQPRGHSNGPARLGPTILIGGLATLVVAFRALLAISAPWGHRHQLFVHQAHIRTNSRRQPQDLVDWGTEVGPDLVVGLDLVAII